MINRTTPSRTKAYRSPATARGPAQSRFITDSPVRPRPTSHTARKAMTTGPRRRMGMEELRMKMKNRLDPSNARKYMPVIKSSPEEKKLGGMIGTVVGGGAGALLGNPMLGAQLGGMAGTAIEGAVAPEEEMKAPPTYAAGSMGTGYGYGGRKMKDGGIHIKPENRGKFTASAKRRGMGVQEFANKVMANKENYSPTMVKRANFARNAAKWKKGYGGKKMAMGGDMTKPYMNGGYAKRMAGGGAYAFAGPRHENGGIPLDANTEIEGGETMDRVSGNSYVFSDRVNVPGTDQTFAERHQMMMNGGATDKQVSDLAAMQEKVTGRAPSGTMAMGGKKQEIPQKGLMSMRKPAIGLGYAYGGMKKLQLGGDPIPRVMGPAPAPGEVIPLGGKTPPGRGPGGRFIPGPRPGTLPVPRGNTLPAPINRGPTGMRPITPNPAFDNFRFGPEGTTNRGIPKGGPRSGPLAPRGNTIPANRPLNTIYKNSLGRRVASGLGRGLGLIGAAYTGYELGNAAGEAMFGEDLPGAIDRYNTNVERRDEAAANAQAAREKATMNAMAWSGDPVFAYTNPLAGPGAQQEAPDEYAQYMLRGFMQEGRPERPAAEPEVDRSEVDIKRRSVVSPRVSSTDLPRRRFNTVDPTTGSANPNVAGGQDVMDAAAEGERGGGFDWETAAQFAPEAINMLTGAFAKPNKPQATRVNRQGLEELQTEYNIDPLLAANARSYRGMLSSPGASSAARIAAMGQKNIADQQAYMQKMNAENQMKARLGLATSRLDTTQAQLDEQVRQEKQKIDAEFGITGNMSRQAIADAARKWLMMKQEDRMSEQDQRMIDMFEKIYGPLDG